jgi:hypothetical protein
MFADRAHANALGINAGRRPGPLLDESHHQDSIEQLFVDAFFAKPSSRRDAVAPIQARSLFDFRVVDCLDQLSARNNLCDAVVAHQGRLAPHAGRAPDGDVAKEPLTLSRWPAPIVACRRQTLFNSVNS